MVSILFFKLGEIKNADVSPCLENRSANDKRKIIRRNFAEGSSGGAGKGSSVTE